MLQTPWHRRLQPRSDVLSQEIQTYDLQQQLPYRSKMFKIILMLIITNTQTNIHVISPCRKLAYTTNLKWLLSSSTKETNACITPVRVDSLSSFPYLDENERNICNDDLVFNVTVIKKICRFVCFLRARVKPIILA